MPNSFGHMLNNIVYEYNLVCQLDSNGKQNLKTSIGQHTVFNNRTRRVYIR